MKIPVYLLLLLTPILSSGTALFLSETPAVSRESDVVSSIEPNLRERKHLASGAEVEEPDVSSSSSSASSSFSSSSPASDQENGGAGSVDRNNVKSMRAPADPQAEERRNLDGREEPTDKAKSSPAHVQMCAFCSDACNYVKLEVSLDFHESAAVGTRTHRAASALYRLSRQQCIPSLQDLQEQVW